MPTHSLGYRPWDGERIPAASRPLVIATTGVRRTAQSKWLRRMLFVAVLPVLFLSIPFFVFEQAVREPATAGRAVSGIVRSLPRNPHTQQLRRIDLATAGPEEIIEIRELIWSMLLLTLFRYPQAVVMILVVGIAAPPLISHDIRSRAFLIYFSRPIQRWEYITGKLGTIAFFLMMITTVPALLLYAAGLILSPSLAVFLDTWDLPLRIMVASFALIIPTTSVALMLSSLTTESRYAAFGWFALWILGYVTYGVLLAFSFANSHQGPGMEVTWQSLLSPYHTLGLVQSWVFGLNLEHEPVKTAAAVLTIVTLFALAIVYRRVSLPMRA